jgi:predicted DNA-binding helix-hairpin-helix protein
LFLLSLPRRAETFRRATFKPDEFAGLFSKMNQRGLAEGVFLSSGLAGGGVRTMDKLLDTADILRKKYQFKGYLHLKIMPGAEKDQVFRAMQLADRVSVNLEAPSTERLARLAPHKIFFEELLRSLKWVEEIRRTTLPINFGTGKYPIFGHAVRGGRRRRKRPRTAQHHPMADEERPPQTRLFLRLPSHPRYAARKQTRRQPHARTSLYQASFLLRDYGFDIEDLPFTTDENLPLHTDPKLAWAQMNLTHQPVELNHADKHQLIKVPGIGIKGAEAILYARRTQKLRDLSALKKLGIIAERAAPYVLLDGRKAATQMNLF